MERCYKCGVSADREELFDAISGKGIVKTCRKCAIQNSLNILKRPQKKIMPAAKPPLSRDISVKMGKDSRTMYDRLSKLSGVQIPEKRDSDTEVAKQNRMLKEVANRNFQAGIMKERGSTADLAENFNWIIMRARRARRLSHIQLAEAIGEPEASIIMAEKGVVPKNVVPFIKKIENYFGVRLFKTPVLTEPPKLDFSSAGLSSASRNLSIKDLKGIKHEDEEEFSGEENSDEDFEEGEEEII